MHGWPQSIVHCTQEIIQMTTFYTARRLGAMLMWWAETISMSLSTIYHINKMKVGSEMKCIALQPPVSLQLEHFNLFLRSESSCFKCGCWPLFCFRPVLLCVLMLNSDVKSTGVHLRM